MASYGEARLTGAPRGNMVEDLTHTSGLIVAFGLLTFVPGTVDLIGSSAENVDWNGSDGVFPPIVGLLANLTVTLFGMSSVIIGFMYLSSKYASKLTALLGLGITLAAWFPFLVTVSLILFQADHKNIAGPPLLVPADASNSEVNTSSCCLVCYMLCSLLCVLLFCGVFFVVQICVNLWPPARMLCTPAVNRDRTGISI